MDADDNLAETWREEIYRRLQEIDQRAVTLVPWEDARKRLWARLERDAPES